MRGAKERAIAPGPRLDRHPDEEEVESGGKRKVNVFFVISGVFF